MTSAATIKPRRFNPIADMAHLRVWGRFKDSTYGRL
jgi:hypothetical protein